MENKDMRKQVFLGECKEADDKDMTVTAYVSTSDKDRMGESLLPEGADLKKFRKNPVVLFGHDYSQPPIGKALWIKNDGKGLISKVQFAPTEFAKEIYELYKGGFMKAFSVGFLPKEWEDGDDKKTARRTYTKWELLEYSAVPVPANPEALSLAMSKGILKNDNLIKILTENEDAKGEWTNNEKVVVDDNTPPDTTTIELLDTIKTLGEEVKGLEQEVAQLKTELYTERIANVAKPRIKDELSEMTVDELKTFVGEIVNGVIRQKQGKLN